METIQDLVDDLTLNRPKYSSTEKRVKTLFKGLRGNVIFLRQSRVKTAASLKKKLQDRDYKYDNEAENVADVRDLVGARIILAFPGDVGQVEEFVKKTFKFRHRTQHPKDNINMVDPKTRFRGYNALHLYVKLQGRRDDQDQNPIIEIQVMHSSMWVYATVHHDVVYKKLYGEPGQALRLSMDQLRGAVNLEELAVTAYEQRHITRNAGSELAYRIESAKDLHKAGQSALQLRNLHHGRDRADSSPDQRLEDLQSEEDAYTLLRTETDNKETHLVGVAEARQILRHLRQTLAMSSHDGPPGIRYLRVLRNLAIAERKLSLSKGLDPGTAMEHLNEAERYIDEAVELNMRSGLVGAQEQMTLEGHILKGLGARLRFRMTVSSVSYLNITRRRLSEASDGIKKALEDLEKVHVVKYEENREFGLDWIDYFGRLIQKLNMNIGR